MLNAEKLKQLLRIYFYADKRVAADVSPHNMDGLLTARRLDEGEYPVIYTSHGSNAPLGAANFIGRKLVGKPALFLVYFSWSMRRPRAAGRLATAATVYRRKRPEHRIVLLCNEDEERRILTAAGAEAVTISGNAFVDEEIFRPLPGTEKIYDAANNAAMLSWKRHGLAERVATCAHIFYEKEHSDHAETMSYLASLRSQMPNHAFINKVVDDRIEVISSHAVNAALAQCRVGMCLSAEEGAMLASVEYMLAGLPVVSTPNVGGRDVFSDPEFWLTVEPTPEAIGDAVTELIRRDVPADRIRARTLKRIYEHRARLRTTVMEATDGQVVMPDNLADPVYRQVSIWETWRDFTARIGFGE